MAVASKTWAVGEIVEAGDKNTYERDNFADLQSNKLNIKVGTYTGDGSTSQAITGVGFAPTDVKIWENDTTDGNSVHVFETTSDFVDNHASGLCLRHNAAGGHVVLTDAIIALGSDGFTVDDRGIDNHPNENLTVYNYRCTGVG